MQSEVSDVSWQSSGVLNCLGLEAQDQDSKGKTKTKTVKILSQDEAVPQDFPSLMSGDKTVNLVTQKVQKQELCNTIGFWAKQPLASLQVSF